MRLDLIQRNCQLACDFLICTAFVFALCFFFEPRWETNDDVAMSMVAHGYGIAAVGMPNLIFSNVVWGYLVRAIPQINGVLGYSIGTIGVLVIVGTAILHAHRKLGFGWLVSLSLLTFFLARPILFPQFTINAGLLTVGAVVCWHLYGQQENRWALLAGCLLAFCGYIVRSQEFLLILLIAVPLLPWAKLARDHTAQASALALLLAIGGAIFVDYQAYQGDDWRDFNALNPARAPITDFGADALLKIHPEILSRHGYTANDIDLIHSWFFVDSKIADPAALNAMLIELGPLPAQNGALTKGWIGIKTLAHPVLAPVFLAALLLLLTNTSRRLLMTWALCLTAIFALGMLGRPGVLRVYIPVLSLLLVAPLLTQGTRNMGQGTLRFGLVQGVVLVAAFFNTTAVFSESRTAQLVSEQTRRDFENFPTEPVVVWGAGFPYEAAYPVLKQSPSAIAFQLYALGVFTHAPFSRATAERMSGKGMVDRLVSSSGIPILAAERHVGLLNIYCNDHLGGVLNQLVTTQYGELSVRVYRCESVVTK